MPRKKIDKLVEFVKGYGAKGLAYIAIAEDGTRKSSFAKFMKDEEMDALVKAMDGKPGDLLLLQQTRQNWYTMYLVPFVLSLQNRWIFLTRTSTVLYG